MASSVTFSIKRHLDYFFLFFIVVVLLIRWDTWIELDNRSRRGQNVRAFNVTSNGLGQADKDSRARGIILIMAGFFFPSSF